MRSSIIALACVSLCACGPGSGSSDPGPEQPPPEDTETGPDEPDEPELPKPDLGELVGDGCEVELLRLDTDSGSDAVDYFQALTLGLGGELVVAGVRDGGELRTAMLWAFTEDGEPLWSSPLADPVDAFVKQPVLVTRLDGAFVVTLFEPVRIAAISSDGTPLWTTEHEGFVDWGALRPTPEGGTLAIGAHNEHLWIRHTADGMATELGGFVSPITDIFVESDRVWATGQSCPKLLEFDSDLASINGWCAGEEEGGTLRVLPTPGGGLVTTGYVSVKKDILTGSVFGGEPYVAWWNRFGDVEAQWRPEPEQALFGTIDDAAFDPDGQLVSVLGEHDFLSAADPGETETKPTAYRHAADGSLIDRCVVERPTIGSSWYASFSQVEVNEAGDVFALLVESWPVSNNSLVRIRW